MPRLDDLAVLGMRVPVPGEEFAQCAGAAVVQPLAKQTHQCVRLGQPASVTGGFVQGQHRL
jgi:hypothetical protein